MLAADSPPASIRRVAFFGGSFDPPHLGHLAVARAAHTALELNTVLFAPVGAQPLKTHGATASYEDRLAMTRLAIAGEAGFEVSLADAPRPAGEPNYTLNTLEALRLGLGANGLLFCLMGADSFLGLRKWHRAAEIPFAAPLIVASRPGQNMDDLRTALPPSLRIEDKPMRDETRGGVQLRTFLLTDTVGERTVLYLLPGLDVPISASEIRQQIHDAAQSGAQPDRNGQLPPAVADYVRLHRLYL